MNDPSNISLRTATQDLSGACMSPSTLQDTSAFPLTSAEQVMNQLPVDLLVATVVAMTVILFLWQMGAASPFVALAYGGAGWALTLTALVGVRMALNHWKSEEANDGPKDAD